MDQRQLVFPQGKEEICKEEVVESQGAVAEGRQIDLQKERPIGILCVGLPCGLDWRGGRRQGKNPCESDHEERERNIERDRTYCFGELMNAGVSCNVASSENCICVD